MAACPSCGKELPGEFPFCPFCAAPLVDAASAAPRNERKVVSVLFCDLVGFTAASEAADPEDVRARIRPYHACLRREIERYDGTVEKFIGDAVMAVFGAPVAHEDDAERAVRAGLRILDAIAELNAEDPELALNVRIGVNTGEALVELDARPEQGEGIATGDVVNTASRLQAAAPVNAIAVSEQTYRATGRVFDYEELEPVRVKGKAEPLLIWRPLQARASFGSDITRRYATPLVGREPEKALLIRTFERSAQQRSCQLVTIVGEPGVGKSRICAELFQYVDERSGLVTWRQGRCLPYGDGIAFWALGEIVKAECGILESDSPEEAAAKLERALPTEDPDLPWLKARLQPLVGAGGEPASQEESFTAWRRFLESLTAEGPTVLVFEDLHWADPAMLLFLEHLADWSEGIALLLLCTARPELYEQHADFGAAARNALRINLAPLTDEETARLLSSLLERSVLSAETQRVLLERAGGNPLYAEEFVRLLADRGELESEDVPDSVQALIAARLDALAPERKSLLQDAAVLGKVFWAGALAEMGSREPHEVEQALHELARTELVRAAGSSSMEDETEHGFWHVLVRDVCYAQIPRAARASRHRAAAAWIEQKAGERAEDLADVLAYHYVTALDLSRAARLDGAQELETQAIRYLTLAGERALGLDVGRAERAFSRALELCPEGHPDRARLLERWARAVAQQNRLQESREAREKALAEHRERGDDIGVGRTLTGLAIDLSYLGEARAEEHLAEAIELLEAQPPGTEMMDAYAVSAAFRISNGDFQGAISAADRASSLASELGLPEPVDALGFRGAARACLGDHLGVEEMRRAQARSVELGHGSRAAGHNNNLAVVIRLYEGPQAALNLARKGIEFAERRGLTARAEFIAANTPAFLAEMGRTEEALAEAVVVADRLEQAGNSTYVYPRSLQLVLLAERGDADVAPGPDGILATGRESGEVQLVSTALAAAARLLAAQGKSEQSLDCLRDLRLRAGPRADPPDVRTALALGDNALARDLFDGFDAFTPFDEHALITCRAQLAEAGGDRAEAAKLYAEAAEGWQKLGDVPARAYALLGQGRCLAVLGMSEAEVPMREARELFASMGYKPALAETEALLAKAVTAAS